MFRGESMQSGWRNTRSSDLLARTKCGGGNGYPANTVLRVVTPQHAIVPAKINVRRDPQNSDGLQRASFSLDTRQSVAGSYDVADQLAACPNHDEHRQIW
jgi:hypothetical protein